MMSHLFCPTLEYPIKRKKNNKSSCSKALLTGSECAPCDVFLGKTLYFYRYTLQVGIGKFDAGGNPTMD